MKEPCQERQHPTAVAAKAEVKNKASRTNKNVVQYLRYVGKSEYDV